MQYTTSIWKVTEPENVPVEQENGRNCMHGKYSNDMIIVMPFVCASKLSDPPKNEILKQRVHFLFHVFEIFSSCRNQWNLGAQNFVTHQNSVFILTPVSGHALLMPFDSPWHSNSACTPLMSVNIGQHSPENSFMVLFYIKVYELAFRYTTITNKIHREQNIENPKESSKHHKLRKLPRHFWIQTLHLLQPHPYFESNSNL